MSNIHVDDEGAGAMDLLRQPGEPVLDDLHREWHEFGQAHHTPKRGDREGESERPHRVWRKGLEPSGSEGQET